MTGSSPDGSMANIATAAARARARRFVPASGVRLEARGVPPTVQLPAAGACGWQHTLRGGHGDLGTPDARECPGHSGITATGGVPAFTAQADAIHGLLLP